MGSGFLAKTSFWLSCAAMVATLTAPALADHLAPVAGSNSSVVASDSNPFTDVPPNNWAYQAIVQLHDDGLLQGYPDGYFRGQRSLTRFEIAVLTKRAVDKLETELSDNQKATKVNSDDIALVRKLLDTYGSDLADVKKDLAVTKTEADASAAELKRAKLHVTIFARAGLNGQRSSIVNGLGNGVTLSPNQGALYGTTSATQGAAYTTNANLRGSGSNNHGTSYETARLGVTGDLSDQLSYEAQLEDNLTYDSINSSSGSTLRLNTAALHYSTPTGWSFTGGRYRAKDGEIGLLYNDYFNGLTATYDHKRFGGQVGYSFNSAANNSVYGIAHQSQTLFAHGKYTFSDNVTGGIGYSSDMFPQGNGTAVSAYVQGQELAVGQATQTEGSLNAEVKVNPKLKLQGELTHHFGKDPIFGNAYAQPNAFWGRGFYGNTTPIVNHNFAEAGYIVSGVNGLSAHNSTFGLGDDYQQFYVGSLDGYHLFYLGGHHYLTDNASVGLVYQRFALNPGVALPAALGSSPVAAGTFLSKDQGQALFLETKLSF